jgi:HD-like signal output (HDOD) protein
MTAGLADTNDRRHAMNANENPNVDKRGDALKAQRFQMLEDIAKELSSDSLVFPTCFDAALKLRKELQNPDLPVSRIARIVALDPLIASRLTHLASSALYSPDGSPARDLQTAVQRLGVEMVRTTALGVAMGQMLRAKDMVLFSDISRSLWDHSIRAAAASRLLARQNGRINPDQAMLAGLVHDLGAFYMLYRAAQYEELRMRPETVKYLILQWHESIGVSLLDALGLPEEIVNATIDHDQPRPLPETMRTLADVVFIGNILAGTHLEWFQEAADPESGPMGEVRQRFAELLPQIESDTQEMLAAFA